MLHPARLPQAAAARPMQPCIRSLYTGRLLFLRPSSWRPSRHTAERPAAATAMAGQEMCLRPCGSGWPAACRHRMSSCGGTGNAMQTTSSRGLHRRVRLPFTL